MRSEYPAIKWTTKWQGSKTKARGCIDVVNYFLQLTFKHKIHIQYNITFFETQLSGLHPITQREPYLCWDIVTRTRTDRNRPVGSTPSLQGCSKLSGFSENDCVWTMICLNWLSHFMICLYLSQYFHYVLFYVTGDSWLADFIITSIVVPVCIPLFGVSYIGSYLFLLLPAWVVGLEVSFPVNCCYLLDEKSRGKKLKLIIKHIISSLFLP